MSHHHSHSEHHEHTAEHREHQEHANHPEVPKHQNEITARAPVDAPEADIAEQAARPAPQKPEGVVAADSPLVPTETPVIKPPIQSVATPEPVHEKVKHDARPVPGKDELLEAEGKIAPFIGANLTGDLTENGLDLNFKEYANGNDKYGIKLCFQGPALTDKSAELGHQVLAALRSHTAFAPLFKSEHTRPHTHKGDQEDMMHILVTNLDREQYINLVDAVRGIVHAKEETKHHGTAIAPQKKEQAEVAEASVPQNVVQGPVASLEKGVNDNEIVPQGVAL